MKIGEMIEELTKNPEKKFIAHSPSYNDKVNVCIRNGDIVFEKEDMGVLAMIALDADYREIREPVNFMLAVKSGKRVKVIHESAIKGNLDYFMSLDTLLLELSLYTSNDIQDIILNGEWYIE